MKKYYELTLALEYIEQHILENCTQEEIAKAAYVSLSSLQKLFRYAFDHSINEYITKRKMTLVADELLISSISITELAKKYGYSTTESFSRAFRKVNCCSPSKHRKGKGVQSTFTPLTLHATGISRKAPALIEAIHQTPDCFVICFDVSNMIDINKISRDTGDLALLHTVQRLQKYTTDLMKIFRIGGDEFAIITPFDQVEDANTFTDCILSHNGETFTYKDKQIPLYLSSWYGKNTLIHDVLDPAKVLHDQVHPHK